LVLCYLEGRTRDEAAQQLGWTVGMVKGRLERGRDALQKRLARRGLGLPAALLVAGLSQTAASANSILMATTVSAATSVAAGKPAATVGVSATVVALTKGGLPSMWITKATLAFGVGACTVATGALSSYAWHHAPANENPIIAKDDTKKPNKDDAPVDQRIKSAAARARSANNLKQIALAMHSYADATGKLPTAAIFDKDGKALLSWRVLLLPYLEHDNLYKQFKLDEPWDSAHNKKLLAQMPPVFKPVGGNVKDPHATYYQVITGKGTLFTGKDAFGFTDIRDGTSNTLLTVEAAEAVPWTKPADLVYEADKPLPKFGGMLAGGFHIGMADGSVRFVKDTFDIDVLRAIITRDDGEVVNPEKLNK
jgi:hypothetical protein